MKKHCLIIFFSFLLSFSLMGQNNFQIKGIVRDVKGEILPGVSIKISKSSIGTVSDINGQFSLTVPDEKSEIVLTYIGFNSKVELVGNKRFFNIQMTETANDLDEVVVVAYGTQKKATVTGAISTMKSSEILKNPVANITNSLTGSIPGLVTVQQSGRPGADDAQIYIRGVSSWVNTQPLIIVDGVEQPSFSQIDPNEIESLSVLKDASSTAVYGIRGANGVILISTKRGATGKPKVSLSANWGLQKPTNVPKFLSSYEQLLLKKIAYTNDGIDPASIEPTFFTPDALEAYRTGSDPYRYPNVNWYNLMVKPSGAPQQQYNVNISGGTQAVKYFISLGYLKQDGLLNGAQLQKLYDPSVYFQRFNFRSNIDLTINKYQTLSTSITGRSEKRNGNQDDNLFYGYLGYQPYVIPVNNPDGSFAALSRNFNPLASFAFGGTSIAKVNNYNLQGTLRNDLSFLIKGLNLDFTYSFDNTFGSTKTYSDQIDTYFLNPQTNVYTIITDDNPYAYSGESFGTPVKRMAFQTKVAYAQKFKKHDVKATLVYNQQQIIKGADVPYVLMGYAARGEYSYADKYLAEVSLGYNGSENFAAGHRFGFFPSMSLGYVLTEEPFMEMLKNKWIPFLKIRGSIGLVGSDQGQDRFLYMAQYSTSNNMDSGFLFGTTVPTTNGGIKEDRASNPLLTWETALKRNVGLEVRLFDKNKLSINVDVFDQDRKDILMQGRSTLVSSGIQSPYLNLGKVYSSGIESQITHRNKIGKVEYSLTGIVTYAKNVVKFKDDPYGMPDYQKDAGYPIGQFKGYQVIGFFQNQQEINSSPSQTSLGGPIVPGDLRYKDTDGDGVITERDKVAIGKSSIPELTYSITPGISCYGFDLSVMFQGAGLNSIVFSGPAGFEFAGGASSGQVTEIQKGYWTVDNPVNASYPSLHINSVHSNKNINSFFLKDGDYIRIRQAQLSYKFSAKTCRQLGVGELRIYVNGSNLFTWSKINNFDPEMVNSSGSVYPQQSVYNFGINVNF